MLGAITLVGVAGVQFATAAVSSSATVTNPASARVVGGRFTSTVVLDGGLITVKPAPASLQSQQGIGGMTAKIWATTQLLNFQPQTLGYGIVTVRGTSKTALPVKNLAAWVGFANGNSTACIKTGGAYRSNGEAFVVIGDERLSPADVYVPLTKLQTLASQKGLDAVAAPVISQVETGVEAVATKVADAAVGDVAKVV